MFKGKSRKVTLPFLIIASGLSTAACGLPTPLPSSPTLVATVAPVGLSIGFFGALTGPNAQSGINIDNGVELAVSQYNQSAKIKVTLVNLDSQGDPDQASQLAQKAISDKLVAVVGPAFSGESFVADPILEQGQIVNVTPSATNPALAAEGWKYWHRIVGSDNAQGPAAAQFIVKRLGSTKVAVIDDGSWYGKSIANSVKSTLLTLSATVPTSQSINPAAPYYLSTVNAIISSGATSVFFGGYYDAAGRLLKQLRNAGFKGQFISDDGALDPKLISTAGNSAVSNTYATCPCGDVSTTVQGRAFTSAYQTMFRSAPGTYSAEGYDAANVILSAIRAGNRTSNGINSYLASHTFTGITKRIQFSSNGDLKGGGIYVYQAEASSSTFSSLGLVSSLVG
ncbi:MAG: branched-chain amino acid ABC transporter substrate-binding protein [Actinomycetota bacterium]|nr:branched-chain amino acid ABC transporter substrate-binding protein [Actinomycetota bacterium]